MNWETAEIDLENQCIRVSIPLDVLYSPEKVPLMLRNVVVLLARLIGAEGKRVDATGKLADWYFELYVEHIGYSGRLEREFRSLLD